MGERLEILITAEDAASGVLSGIKGALGGLGSLASGALTLGLGAATVGLGGLAAGLGVALNEAIDAQKIMAQTEAVIKSTGGAAGLSAEQIADMAGALAKTSTFSDDAIQQGENLLLTFTNIGKDVFPDATASLVDLAAAMGTDVKSGAIQLGKALNDPVAGITALTRVGVSFSEDQKKVIEQLVKTGDVAGAQKIILAELNKEFGGSAAAQAQTFGGRLENLKNQLLNVAEGIGTSLLPIGEELLNRFIVPVVPLVEQFAGVLTDLFNGLASGEDPIGSFANAVFTLGQMFGLSRDDATTLFNQVITLREPFEQLMNLWNSMATGGGGSFLANLIPPDIAAQIQPLLDAIQNLASAFAEKLPAMQTAGQAFLDWLGGAFGTVGPQLLANITTALNAIAEFWRAHGDQIIQIVSVTFQILSATILGAITLVSGIISAALQLLNGNWQGAWDTMGQTFTAFMNMVLSIAGTNLTEFTKTWQSNWEMLKIIVNKVVMDVTSGFQAFIINLINTGRSYFDEFKLLGQQLVSHMLLGITSMVSQAISAVTGLVNSSIGAAGKALGDLNPFTNLPGADIPGFATGGSFVVGGTGGTDSQLVMFRATPGEPVTVGAGAGQTVKLADTVNINYPMDYEVALREMVRLMKTG